MKRVAVGEADVRASSKRALPISCYFIRGLLHLMLFLPSKLLLNAVRM
jgi:hypothetical protein